MRSPTAGKQWVPVLDRFWKEFKKQVDFVDESVTREDVSEARELGKDPVTGKPISVRYGKYGPFVQLGTKDDEEKPKFASLRPHQRMDAITLADALELFKLPRTLGHMPTANRSRSRSAASVRTCSTATKKFVSDQGRRSVHSRTAARAGADPREGRARRESHHSRFPRSRHPGAERPLRPVHHRSREERQDSEGPRAEDADAR